ncbi:hypothetical protein GCM10007880_31760 [Mesorhizobium amorphae]|nr:hypothetical protein GCM10007880_31760 [Mesorhizobium amorphae]
MRNPLPPVSFAPLRTGYESRNADFFKNRGQQRAAWLTGNTSLTLSAWDILESSIMKKTYEKPVLVKKSRLSAITAGNGASGPVIEPG